MLFANQRFQSANRWPAPLQNIAYHRACRGVRPGPLRGPAAALDSSEAAAPKPLVTAVLAAAAAAPRLAVKAAPTAAPVLKQERKISTGTII